MSFVFSGTARPITSVPVDAGGFKITSVGTPTVGTDAANKAYSDSVAGGGWTETGTVVNLTTGTDTVAIGAAAMVGAEKVRVTAGTTLLDFTSTTALQVAQTGGGSPALVVNTTNGRVGVNTTPGVFALDVNGDTRITGKLTVTGALDPTSVLLSGGSSLYFESNDGSTAPVSGVATGRLRYNNGLSRWEQSIQGGAYTALSGGGGVTGSGTTGRITKWTSSSAVGNSLLSETGSVVTNDGALSIVPTVDQVQLLVRAATAATQPQVRITDETATFNLDLSVVTGTGNVDVTMPGTLAEWAGSNASPVSLEVSNAVAGAMLAASGAGAGDVVLQLNSTTATWTGGIDESIGGRFALAKTSILGTGNDVLRITTDGLYSYIGQPATVFAAETTTHDYRLDGGTITFTTGATIPTERTVRFRQPTYAATALTQTITDAATVSIDGPPLAGTNVAITNPLALDVTGNTRVTGKLTVTGAIDPTSLALSGGTALYLESADGSTAPLSAAGFGRIRYNNGLTRWEQSTGGAAYASFGGSNFYAPDRIVDASGSTGTDTTIATAIAALPATGGTIYVKAGTYTLAATLVLPGSKNVTIIGAGKGATVLNLTIGAVPLFQVAAAATGKYALRDFTATGDGSTAQVFFDLASAVDVSVDNVDVTGIRDIVDDAAAAEVVFSHCSFALGSASSSFWRGTGAAGTLVWIYTEATLATAASGAIVGSPDWQATDSYIGGPGASFYAVGQAIWQTFRLDSAEVTVSVGNSRIDECDFNNAGVIFTSTSNVVGDSVFFGGSPSTFLALRFGGAANVVSGNSFNGGSTTAIDILAAATETVISGNQFFPTYFSCVKNASSNCDMSGNSGMQVIESGAANNNRYTGNTVFSASTILGADCVVEGVRRKDVTGGATVDALTAVFTHVNTKGLGGSGTIKNTGVTNSLTIRRTAIDAFATSDFIEDVVLPGASLSWTLDAAVNTAVAPFSSFTVSVQSTSAGNPTTYSLRQASMGAY